MLLGDQDLDELVDLEVQQRAYHHLPLRYSDIIWLPLAIEIQVNGL